MMKTQQTPINVDEYIKQFPASVQKKLKELRAVITKTAPEAVETISYKMPAYKFHGILVYFAGYKKHIGFYATPNSHKQFEKELSDYKTGKGSVQFPNDKPLPIALIAKIVKYKARENLRKTEKK